MREDLDASLVRWRDLLGDAHVWTDPARLTAGARTTFATTQRSDAVIRPADAAQVAACVRIAFEHDVPLYPLSCGKNLGYGSRVPSRDGAVVLDLGRLDRIVDFDERLAYVTVEPGVTFRQLSRFLRTCRARVFASVTGGPADASVLANALERGDGSGPLGDRFAHVAGLEVVLPDGGRLETGFGRFAGAATTPLATWGVGPALDGLFSQSGLGVVTRMTIWLAPYPASFALGWWTAAALPPVVEALRGLRLTGVVTATTPVWNDLKLLTVVGRYPWDEAGTTPLPEAVRRELRARARFGLWNGTVSLYGASAAHLAALRELVTAAIDGIAFQAGPADPLDAEEEACGPALGVPHDRNLASLYWRKRAVPAQLDPDADGCGFVWLSHGVPFEGGHAERAAAVVETELGAAGFEPCVALLGVTPRMLQLVASISYDRDIGGEDERALACCARARAALQALGYPPFRAGLQDLDPGRGASPVYDRFVDAITQAIDPKHILRR